MGYKCTAIVFAAALSLAFSVSPIDANYPTSMKTAIPTTGVYSFCNGYYVDNDQESSQYYMDPSETFADCANGCTASSTCAAFEIDIDRTGQDRYSICYYFNAAPPPSDFSYYLNENEQLGIYYKRLDPAFPPASDLPESCETVLCAAGSCTPIITPSSASKRARRSNETQQRLAAAELCSPNEDVCFFSSTGGNYECIDYLHDIASCGGCVHSGEGVDCLAIEGVSGVGCVGGACVAASCLPGWKLMEDTCVEE